MPLATKNGSLIVKDGQIAENCDCCGGWYCYDINCAYTAAGYNSLWVCSDDPPNYITLKVTFSNQQWCFWGFEGGDEKGPTTAVQMTREASTEFNGQFQMSLGSITVIPQSDMTNSYSYKCGYSGTFSGPWGTYSFSIAPGNNGKQELPVGSPWEAWLFGTLPLRQYRIGSTAMPYSQWLSSQPSCSPSTNGAVSYIATSSAVAARPRNSLFPSISNGAYTDNGPFTGPKPTLSSAKWTFTHSGFRVGDDQLKPFCVVEVVEQ